MGQMLNLERLRSITQGNRALEAKIRDLYQKTGEKCLSVLHGMARNDNDPHAWHDACHELKGASANIGAEAMQEICAEAEHCEPGQRADRLARMEDIFRQVMEKLRAL